MTGRSSWAAAAALALLAPACGPAAEPQVPPPPAAPSPLGTILFAEIAAPAGLDVVHVGGGATADWLIDTLGSGGAWIDYDGDGDADLYLAQGATEAAPAGGPPDRLLRNDGTIDGVPRFTDLTRAAGLGDKRWSFGAAVGDYDGDGDADLYLCNWGPNRLYRNNGDGTFTDVAPAAGVAHAGWSVSAAWADADRDGDLDLFVVNYVDWSFERYPRRGEADSPGNPPFKWKDVEVAVGPRGLEPERDVYFRNDGDPDGDGVPRFTDATRAAGFTLREAAYGLAARFFDADDDGDADLYVANDSVANHFFVNDGTGRFVERGVLAGLAYNEQGHEQASMGIGVADFSGDGRLDLAVTNFSHDHDTLYRNDGAGQFTDVSFATGIGGVTYLTLSWGIEFWDLDHDGLEDSLLAHGHVYPQVEERDLGVTFRQRNRVFRHGPPGRFVEATAGAGPGLAPVKSSRALLPVDLEGDGDMDFVVTNLNDTPDLLRNDGAAAHWLEVRLAGTGVNRDGVGARVIVEAGGSRQVRELTTTGSYASAHLPVAHFGLGATRRVDRLEVRWPSGVVSVADGLAADRLVWLPEAAPRKAQE
jgi:hypothetical protein